MQTLHHRLRENGFAVSDWTEPGARSIDVAHGIAEEIGAVVAGTVHHLGVTEAGAKPLNTYGGNYGSAELPLHSDLAHWYRPPRYVMLRCIEGAAGVSTRLIGVPALEQVFPKSLMRRALFSPRRRLEGKMYLLRMLTGEMLRWDQLFLKPQNREARVVVGLMQENESRLPITEIRLARPGSTLIIDNWRALHGRSHVPERDAGRKIDRIYLETLQHGQEDAA